MLVETLKRIFSKAGKNGPSALKKEIAGLKALLATYEKGWPPGHFYSPLPSLEEVRAREEKIWGPPSSRLPGIRLRETEQLVLFHQLAAYYDQQPWKAEQQEGWRFYFNNPNFSYGEAILYFCMLLHLRPKHLIEIGSGFSSCALLDTREKFLHPQPSICFIEPYPELLHSLLQASDRERLQILPANLQDVPLETFDLLGQDDILFIDSTHVSKINSDVNHIFFEILPRLKSGVCVHFHDIYFPFEYPKEWIYQGRAWNEAYVLRAFLEYNDQFDIMLFNSFLGCFHQDLIREKMPLCEKHPGSSIWLRKR